MFFHTLGRGPGAVTVSVFLEELFYVFLGVPDFDVTVLTHPWMVFIVEFFVFLRCCFCALQWESGWETDVINLGPADGKLMSSTLAQQDCGTSGPSGCHEWCPCVCAL